MPPRWRSLHLRKARQIGKSMPGEYPDIIQDECLRWEMVNQIPAPTVDSGHISKSLAVGLRYYSCREVRKRWF